jgi:hypothetical protein
MPMTAGTPGARQHPFPEAGRCDGMAPSQAAGRANARKGIILPKAQINAN